MPRWPAKPDETEDSGCYVHTNTVQVRGCCRQPRCARQLTRSPGVLALDALRRPQEDHHKPIYCVCFNHVDPNNAHIFASVAVNRVRGCAGLRCTGHAPRALPALR